MSAVPGIRNVNILRKRAGSTKLRDKIIVIGGGLAGVEAAYQISKREIPVDLIEMRPLVKTEAHQSEYLGEMVCSNSLGSEEMLSASGLFKSELKLLDSFFLKIADLNRVPSGRSFAVDRGKLAARITDEIRKIPNINVIHQEVSQVPVGENPVIVATGPLTSDAFAESLTKITMRKNLFFYDATSPIIRADSIDYDQVFFASRYDKGEADFLNIPLDENEYNDFVKELVAGETVEPRDFEKKIFFEACLPVEEIARRGEKSLSFGPLKPVGLVNPKTGERPYAVIQLRQDDIGREFFQMVGFQTRLKWGEQKRIFRQLRGLENAEFERFGRMHRNTYINAPLLLDNRFQSKQAENLFFAGQISGVEGYIESIGSGLMAGMFAAARFQGISCPPLPLDTANGALIHHITTAGWRNFAPTKFTYGLLPSLKGPKKRKKIEKQMRADIAIESLKKWIENAPI